MFRAFIVGGGGGGGARCGGGGGGGGGGFICKEINVSGSSSYPITIGAGGASGTGPEGSAPGCAEGTTGSNSVFACNTSSGGGGGGSGEDNSTNGRTSRWFWWWRWW